MAKPIYFIAKFTNETRVDREAKIIRGVSVITGDIKAEGHDLWTDDTTLLQMKQRGEARKKVPVKENHRKGEDPTGVEAYCGYLTNFSIDGKQTRADLHLLKSHPRCDLYLDIAETAPETLGLSAAFEPPEKKVVLQGKPRARVEKLLSVDLVSTPAANPTGLFEAGVDTSRGAMPDENQNSNLAPTKEPTIADVLASLTKINERFDAIDKRFSDLEAANAEPATIEDLQQMAQATDEQLAEIGLTREQVESALEAALEAAGNENVDTEADAAAAAAAKTAATAKTGTPAAAEAAAAAPAGAALSAMQKRLVMLEKRFAAEDAAVEAAERAEAKAAFDDLQKKITELEATNAAQAKILEAKGVKPLKPGQVEAVELDAKNKPDPNSFEGLVELAVKGGKTRNQAMIEVAKKHPLAHGEWLSRKGVTQQL